MIKKINKFWNKAKKENPFLFNGESYIIVKANYKQVLGIQKGIIKDAYCIGISCIIKDAQGEYLIMKRSKNVNEYPTYYDLVSGGITSMSLYDNARREFKEETGLPIHEIKCTELYDIYLDDKNKVLDVIFKITTLKSLWAYNIKLNKENLTYKLMGKEAIRRLLKDEKCTPVLRKTLIEDDE